MHAFAYYTVRTVHHMHMHCTLTSSSTLYCYMLQQQHMHQAQIHTVKPKIHRAALGVDNMNLCDGEVVLRITTVYVW